MTDIGGRVYFISGASGGIGLEIVLQLLGQGMRVAATSRDKKKLIESLKDRDNSLIRDDNFIAIEMDLNSESSIKKAVSECMSKFKTIYCVINNSGYGLKGTIEELTLKEIQENFNVNCFGPMMVIHHFMPHLKCKPYHDPRIINVSSVVGFNGDLMNRFPSYVSSKFALDGFTESISNDLSKYGIKCTSVKPGYFITPFNDNIVHSKGEQPLTDHEKEILEKYNATKPKNSGSDPIKGARALIQISLDPSPPLHLFLGSDALKHADSKIQKVEADINKWAELSKSTDN
ncbi:hypothetical protein RB653_004662 [Dictyostelium firmibasis]|uniref:Uncharacterized protein n=1 Tax=Dictyostelium firmibasis TaxID=79012 RepID=A0AAN7Z0B3_9MYCE